MEIILESFELINFYFKMKNSIILTALKTSVVYFVKQTGSHLSYILIMFNFKYNFKSCVLCLPQFHGILF